MSQLQLNKILKAYASTRAATKGMSEQEAFDKMFEFATSVPLNADGTSQKLVNFFVAIMSMEFPGQSGNPKFVGIASQAQTDVVTQITSAFSPETGFGSNGENLKTVDDFYASLYSAVADAGNQPSELVSQAELPHDEI